MTVMKIGERIKRLQEAQQRRVAAKARVVVTHAPSHCLQSLQRLLALNKWLDMKSSRKYGVSSKKEIFM